MKKLTLVIVSIGSMALGACASNPNKAAQLDTKIDYAAPVSNGVTIGVKDGDMVAQKQVLMSEELRLLQNQTYELEAQVYGGPRYLDNRGLWGALRDCHVEQAKDTGEIIPLAERRNYVVPEDDYKMGLDGQHNIVGLEREYLKDRVERFKKYRQVLQDRKDEYQDKLDQCEIQKQARN